MKLDERFKVLPFCCFGAEKCVKYIGQKGYFTNNIDFFKNIDFCIYGTLEEVHAEQADSFQMDNKKFFRYFIPEYFVKPKEKKYRPYTLNEFLKEIPMHTVITMRKKVDNDCIVTCTFTGYRTRCICTDVCLGVEWISLGTLADEYEYKNTYIGNWKPFGVEE